VPQPGEKQVLVRLAAIGVNPVETYIRAGIYPRAASPPYTPGTDGAGTIEAVGPGVGKYLVGDKVYLSGSITGSYAELAVCALPDIHPLPPAISFEQGAAIGVPYATAYRALFHRGNAQPSETVLIHGASGGVGTAATQLARAAGLIVIGTAGTDEGLKLVKSQGADHVLNHRQPGYLDEIKKLTGGAGVDLIIEMLANVNLGHDLPLLAHGGRVVVVGSRGKVEITPRDAMSRDASILAMSLPNSSPKDLERIHAALIAGFANGSLRPEIGRQFPLADAPKAHEAVMEPGARGKIILLP
jgi:NADPH2:quinone reductase